MKSKSIVVSLYLDRLESQHNETSSNRYFKLENQMCTVNSEGLVMKTGVCKLAHSEQVK